MSTFNLLVFPESKWGLRLVMVAVDDDFWLGLYQYVKRIHKINLKKGQPMWLPKSFFVGCD
jgi:hypothetical protein